MKFMRGNIPKQSETSILTQIRSFLRLNSWYIIRIQQGLGCHKGISDLIAIKKGRVVFIEIKTSKGKLSIHQQRFRLDIEYYGGEYVIMRNFEDAEEFIKEEQT